MNEKELFSRISAHIKAHSEGVAEIIGKGHVAVVVCEPDQKTVDCLRQAYGWNGEPFFCLSSNQRKALARNLEADYDDKAAARWLAANGRNGRMLVFVRGGSLCVNLTPGKGYEIVPGTLDSERAKAMH
jgi:hypothetical protein